MPQTAALQDGFSDYGPQANATFRACLDAMSRPGTIVPAPVSLSPPRPLSGPAAAVLLTLADFESAIWLDPTFASEPAVADYLRFHAGVSIVDEPGQSDFALIDDPRQMPEFAEFQLGTPEYPDRSTTLIIQVAQLETSGLTLRGPGIRGEISFAPAPAPSNFQAQLTANRGRFPCGVDLLFVTDTHVSALPRSVVATGGL